MSLLALFRICRHELLVLFLDGKLLATLTLVPCVFILILSGTARTTSLPYVLLAPLPPELPALSDEALHSLAQQLAVGDEEAQSLLKDALAESVRSILLSRSPTEAEFLTAEKALKEYYRGLSSEEQEAFRVFALPEETAPDEEPATEPPAGSDDKPKPPPPTKLPAPPPSEIAIVRKFIAKYRDKNDWLIQARPDFPSELEQLVRAGAPPPPLTAFWVKNFRSVLQTYYLHPVAADPLAKSSTVLDQISKSWTRYGTLCTKLSLGPEHLDDHQFTAGEFSQIHALLRKMMGEGQIRPFKSGRSLEEELKSLKASEPVFYWSGVWNVYVPDSLVSQDPRTQQARTTTLTVMNWYTAMSPLPSEQDAVATDSITVALNTLLNFGDSHAGYDTRADDYWRGIIILGLFPPVMAFFLASGQIQRDRQYGVLPLLMMATGRRSFLGIVGRIFAVVCTTVLIFNIMVAVSFLLSDLPEQLPTLRQVGTFLICLVSAALCGLACSFWIQSERQAYFITAVLIIASILFGGAVESIANANPLSRFIGNCLPSATFLAILREWAGSTSNPMSWLQLGPKCLQPLGVGLSAILLSSLFWKERF